jgi:hypothetical protein
VRNVDFFKITLVMVEFSGHLFITTSELFASVNGSRRCHFQVPEGDGVGSLIFPGGDFKGAPDPIRNSLGGMSHKEKGAARQGTAPFVF